ncbi:MAG: EVE domain-containing protein [Candidatus Dojkabacteria bacterium]|nr:EVE domain-containing protein [Candidatus Dojkabacteria bacterium]
MKYYLFKTDPDTYSIDDLQKDRVTRWDGVHNYQAINVIKSMQIRDLVFIYHSQSDKAIVGLAKVISAPYENKDDSRYSWVVDVEFVKKYDRTVTLSEIKNFVARQNVEFLLVKNPRLSCMPVPDQILSFLLDKLK